ncbi:uncharacterized protein LOC111318909 [Stylophora pistillata]|uniref:uncharacterized protein LOC111318909 n=1 Tax=Stylophora pistillata TaxID=50429 RepID=UPI000C0482D3|nr:uncharacterized protein LOC111318909 [Stylophora pistillata]
MALKATFLLSIVFLALTEASNKNPLYSSRCKGDSCPRPKDYLQDNKKFRPISCLDYLLKGASTCGMYRLYDSTGNSFPAYCDFKSEPGLAWTLVMSWANKYRKVSNLRGNPFKQNAPVNENSLIWNMYRLSLTRMRSLQAHSTHWRATCSYPTHGVDFTDYVRGNFKDFNIVDFIGGGKCKKVEFVNIRGHIGIHLTAKFWQSTSAMLRIVSSHAGCNFDPRSGSVSGEDNFGYYSDINHKFRCTAGDLSTTQWWFGAHL